MAEDRKRQKRKEEREREKAFFNICANGKREREREWTSHGFPL